LFKVFRNLIKISTFNFWLRAIALTFPWNNIISSANGIFFAITFLFQNQLGFLNSTLNRGWLVFSGWLVLTTFTAYDPSLAWTGLFNFLPFLLFSAIARFILSDFAKKIEIAWLVTLGSLSVGMLGIFQILINRPDWQLPRLFSSYIINLGMSSDRRITAWFGHFNELAIYLLLVFPLAIFFLKYGNRNQKIIATTSILLDAICLYFSGSRNAWAIAAIGLMAIAAYYRYWRILLGLGLAAVITGWAVFGENLGIGGEWLQILFPTAFVQRLQSTVNPSLNDFASTSDRLNAWNFALDLISQRPILGWGLRSFTMLAAVFAYDLKSLPHEHNFYLLLAVGAGIPALLALIGLVGATAWQNFTAVVCPQQRDLQFLTWLAIASFLLFSLADVPIYEPRVNLLFWLLMAL
jgi:O-antigen ligase